ncbi:hypothetical protein [Mesotoga sp. UBA5847]|jgi:hypothetical protein|uniref:hypothetical protein n=1 Tax=Mesotoga sp. UBA5847 TaxID=1946859 RepID=UPI0025F01D1B|nr:hypothetical protein [Mesotoga sp. UBA5847]
MKSDVSLEASKYPFEEYFADYSVSEETRNKLITKDILILPEPHEHSKYYFAQESLDFLKFCKSLDDGVNLDILADSNRIIVFERRSFDIWMPTIWIAEKVLLPIVVGLVTSYILRRIRGREKEECKVNLSIIVKNGEESKELRYNGDAKTFREKFDNIDLDNL